VSTTLTYKEHVARAVNTLTPWSLCYLQSLSFAEHAAIVDFLFNVQLTKDGNRNAETSDPQHKIDTAELLDDQTHRISFLPRSDNIHALIQRMLTRTHPAAR